MKSLRSIRSRNRKIRGIAAAAFACALALAIVVGGRGTPALADTGTVTVNFNNTTVQGTPDLFGGSKFPQQAQANDVISKLASAGVNTIRTDMYLEHVLPSTTVANYEANVNNVQNPSTWDWDNLWGLNQAKADGIQTMLIADYTPPWLSYSGSRTGVPDNWSVWEDIVAKTYERYASDIGWVEVWNEPDIGTLDLTGSPYTTKEAAIAAIYYYTVQAIRSTGSTVPIGGPAFAGNNTGSLNTILHDLVAAHGEAWVQQNFNFYSFHDYGADPGGAISAAAIRSVLTANGLSANLPIYITEYNITPDWHGTNPELSTDAAVGYVGRSLAKFIQQGVGADYFSFYPYNYPLSDTVYEDGVKTSLAMYYVTGNGSTGTLFSQANPMRILSTDLGLGNGSYASKQITTSVVDGAAAVNSAGQSVAFLANYYSTSNTVNLVVNGVPGSSVNVTEYLGTGTDTGSSPYATLTLPVSNGTATTTLTMPKESVIGLNFGNLGNSAATVTGHITAGVDSSQCIDVNGGNATPGTKIDLYTCNTSGAQSWTRNGDGTIRALGECLEANGGNTTNGTKIDLYTCNGTGAQQWVPGANNSLVNPHSGLCLDDPGGVTSGGPQLELYTCNGTPAQRWYLP